MNFTDEVKLFKTIFLKADYLLRFMESIIRNLKSTMDEVDQFIIPQSLFDEHKPYILIDILFCEKNENQSKALSKKIVFQ